ncbi:barstar family protein [Oribacterium sp. WCC10]|uniref:barstar family protein n=1 Tax=Oribacterium sp. WCC10 TaxID=1855343 RepID=UPI0008EB55F4|nr:barstar family protein [Oribacterium sp. WCC10]SFG42685.1 Barstar (barnase inhibitor) [Oribacterium sp. WCC10]
MKYILDLSDVTDRDELYDAIEDQLPVPSHFGRNLDALYDDLSDAINDCDLIVKNFDEFAESDPAYFKKFKHTLKDLMVDIPDFTVHFSSDDEPDDDYDNGEESEYDDSGDDYSDPDDNYSDSDEYDKMETD